ncbi:MAG TPA: hypothetical protein PLL69_05385 [Gemmatimonadales bacterium]|nr:hypothetical protein [Gemmatimonadales bacterium]
MHARLMVDSLVAGTFWGLLAFLLGHRAWGPAIWPGVLAAPFLGVAVGALTQARFENSSGVRRALVALVSLYLGGTLFGIVIGIGTWLGISPGARRFPAVLVEPVLGVWWGLTVTGFFLVLWPLAYFTHWWVEWRGSEPGKS